MRWMSGSWGALMEPGDPEGREDLLALLEAQLFRIVTEGPCEHCGRSAASVQELELIRKYLNTHGVIKTPGYRDGQERGPSAMKHGSPFPDQEDLTAEA